MKKLLKYMKEYRLRCILAPAFKVLEATSELFVPLVMAQMIDIGIKNADSGYITARAGILGALAVLGLSFTVIAQYFAATAAVGFTANIKKALYQKILRREYKDIDRIGTATLLSRMTNDVKEIQNGTNLTLRLLIRSPFIVFGAAVMAFTVDASGAVSFVIVIPLLMVAVFAIMLSSIPVFKKVQSQLERVMTSVREHLFGVRVIRSFGIEKREEDSFDEKNRALEKITVTAGKISALMNPVTYIIINGGIILLLSKGAIRVESGALSSGQVVALYNYMSQILIELLKLASLIISISKSLSAASRIEEVLEDEDAKEGDAIPSDDADTAIEVKNMTFRYEGAGAPALSNISLSVKKGETVGIIGPTGSGKTTLVNLLPGYYLPTEGDVLIGGVPTSECEKSALRRLFHVVPQRSVLFRGTVRDNLLWGNENATDEELFTAAENAMALDFLREKDLLDTSIGEGGSGLSGGQRQRLAIARALVGDPEFLILDDSASALDLATDKALRKKLATLPFSPTVFIVSQRTSSIMHADKILVLSDGECVGLGTHSELLSSCPTYRDIFASQYGKDALPAFERKEVTE